MPTKPYTFTDATAAVADEVNANFDEIFDWANQDAMDRAASAAFTQIPSGPATDPTGANQFTRKAYVDARVTQRFKAGFKSGTTDASGYMTVTHSAGWTPLGVVVTGSTPSSGQNIPCAVVADLFTGTTFRVRFVAVDASQDLTSVAVTFSWIAFSAVP